VKTTNTEQTQKTQSISNLPLFSWRSAVVHVQPTTCGGQFVMRRHRVHPGLADLVAALAGLGEVRS